MHEAPCVELYAAGLITPLEGAHRFWGYKRWSALRPLLR
jgi:hypothetical protein